MFSMLKMKTYHHWIATAAVLAVFLSGCGKEDPITQQEEHYEAEGLVLLDGGQRFFRYFQGRIDSGDGRAEALEVGHGEVTSKWSIRFLDRDGNEMAPPTGEGFSFTWEIADTSIVEVVQDASEVGKFVFALRGLKDGETTIKLQIAHEGHIDFTTVPLPVHVGGEFEAEGLVIIESGVRFFRYFQGEIDSGDGRVSELTAPVGMTPHWRINFLDENGDEIDPPEYPEFTFGWTIADPDVVEVVQDEGDEGLFEFHLRGLKGGETTIVLKVEHDGHTDFSTKPIPVHVEEEFAAEGLVLIESGTRFFRYFQGAIDSGDGRVSELEVPVGLTPHWGIKFLDENGDEIDPPDDPEFTLGWTIADPNVLEVVQDEGEEGSFEFHLRGLKGGETTIVLKVEHDGHTDFSTKPIPVHVEEEFAAEGLVLIESGVRFFRYFQGTIDSGDGRVSELEVPIGLTPHWGIKFLDENGDEIDPPDDPEFTLGWTIADPGVLEVVQDEGEEGSFEFHLRGLQKGETTIVLKVNHDGHTDFTTQPIPVHVEEEFAAEGLVLIESGVRFFRYFQGAIDSGDGRVSELDVPIGLTPHWRIKFLDENGDEIDPPEDPEFTFGWTIADPSVLEVVQDEGDEGSFEFHLRGLQEGETTIVFEVRHDGHVDYMTQPIHVHVEAQEGQHEDPVGVRLKDEDSGDVLTQAPLKGEGNAEEELTVAAGDSTDHIVAFFYDEHDVEFQPEAPDHALGIAVADTSLLAIDPPVAPEYWAFRLIGKKAGTTSITLSILHDGEKEEEFEPISVEITAP